MHISCKESTLHAPFVEEESVRHVRQALKVYLIVLPKINVLKTQPKKSHSMSHFLCRRFWHLDLYYIQCQVLSRADFTD